jgi:hypothetical protein
MSIPKVIRGKCPSSPGLSLPQLAPEVELNKSQKAIVFKDIVLDEILFLALQALVTYLPMK